jgi:phosphatidylinositol alpha-mannosyltransferase
MASSMFARALAWFYIAKAAMPGAPLRRRDFASATMIGVLMSATLPARLCEHARALALARHTGQTKENLPVVVGTLVSQTFLNLMSLLLLGLIIVSSTDLFHNSTKALFTISLLPWPAPGRDHPAADPQTPGQQPHRQGRPRHTTR